MALLPGVTNLATVAQVDLGTATDIATDSLGAFGLMTKDTEQLTANFTRVQDVMAKTTATSNTSLIDLFEAVKKGASDFVNAGQSMETFNAFAGIMANSGKKGAEAGTVLRNVMLRLAKPTKEAQDALDALGVSTRDSKGNFRDAIDVMADLEKGLIGKGSAERAAALGTIFGARQTGAINILLKEGTESIRTYRSELEKAGGSAEKMAEIMRGSLTNQLASLKSAAIEVGFQLFDAFSGEGAGAIQGLTQFVRQIDMTPVIEGLSFVIEKGKMVFETLSQAGVFDLLQANFGALISVIKLLWSIAEPIFKLMWKVLKPIVKGVTFTMKGVGFIADALAGGTPKGSQTAAPNLAAAQFSSQAPQAPQRQAPNQTQTQLNLTRVDFRGQIDIAGAPEGSKAESSNSQVDMNMMGSPYKKAS
jgi:TP901 family phage tail tape measure protein